MQEVVIREGTIKEVVALSKQIPEFIVPPEEDAYHERMDGVPHLILVAEVDGALAGFKAGYERDGSFYSWMGAILPRYRRLHLAKNLATHQENWARAQGYPSITFKTRNQHKGMLIFALKNGFDIIDFKARENIAVNRILLRKDL